MAATDLSGEALPAVGFLTKRVTLDATANNAREIILPTWARRVSVFVVDGSNVAQLGALASSGTGGGSIFVSATTASSFAQLMLEQE
jgi:hypothetical protein